MLNYISQLSIFVHSGAEPSDPTILEDLVGTNPQCYAQINAYPETVCSLWARFTTNIYLLPNSAYWCLFSGRISCELGNLLYGLSEWRIHGNNVDGWWLDTEKITCWEQARINIFKHILKEIQPCRVGTWPSTPSHPVGLFWHALLLVVRSVALGYYQPRVDRGSQSGEPPSPRISYAAFETGRIWEVLTQVTSLLI